MGVLTPLEALEEEERRARLKLAAYRARLYCHDATSPAAPQIRLSEFERRWIRAAERLQRARNRSREPVA